MRRDEQEANKNTSTAKSTASLLIFLALAFWLVPVLVRSYIQNSTATDVVGPEIVILSPQNMTYATTSIQLIFAVDGEASWMGYSLDFQENVTIVENVTLDGLSDGGHNVMVFSRDTSGLLKASERVYFTVSPLHDVAVIDISLPFSEIYSGETIGLNVTVKDKGTVPESFNVTVYCNSSVIETKPVNNLTQGLDSILTYRWNTTEVPSGVYRIKAEASTVAGETNIDDNVLVYGLVKFYPKPPVQIIPATIQAKVELSFEVSICIVNITNLCHFQFDLHYSSSLLYVEEVLVCDEFGMLLTSPYASGSIHNDGMSGNLSVSLTQSSKAIPVNGTGQIARIRFRIANTISYSWKPNSTNLLQSALSLNNLKIGVRFENVRLLEQYDDEISVHGAEYKFTPVPGDLNLDGMTDVVDLCGCCKKFGETGECIFDLDGNLIVDQHDLFLIAKNMARTKP